MIKTLHNVLKQDKERFRIPRSVQDIIPIKTIWNDGIFKVGSCFAKTFKFSDINYAMLSQDDTRELFLKYSDLINGACMLLDFDLMQSAVVNLVTNAMKASSIGQTIEVLADEHGIEVKDYGIGIPSQDLNSVTEPFYMVDKSRAHQNNSCGLGLSLVKSIVNAHGAQLVIRSMPGIGTTVRISWNSK